MDDLFYFIVSIWSHVKVFASHYYPVVIKGGIILVFVKLPCSFLMDYLKKNMKRTNLYDKFLKKYLEEESSAFKLIDKQVNKGRSVKVSYDEKGKVKEVIICKGDNTHFTAYSKRKKK